MLALLSIALITFFAMLMLMFINTLGIKPELQDEKLYVRIKDKEPHEHSD